MNQNKMLTEVFAQSTKVPTSPPPDSGKYYKPVSTVCPSQRYMVKAFHLDNKECWVIKPEVQQLRYTYCSDQYNRECHYCSANKGGTSKCEEEYEWQKVWAYCKPKYVQPKYVKPTPYVKPTYVNKPTYVQPKPQTYPTYRRNQYPQPKPYRSRQTYPKPTPYYQPTRSQAKIWAKPSPRYSQYQQRWKRSVHQVQGKIEQISLFLPFQCSCKNFKC